MGPKKGPDGKLAITFPMGDKKLPGIAAEDIGKCAYGIFKKGPRVHRQDRRHRRRAPDRRADGRRPHEGAGGGGALQRRVPRRCTVASDSRAPKTSGNMFQFKRDFERRLLRGTRRRRRAVPQPLAADVRGLACREQEPDPDRKGIPARSGRMTETVPRSSTGEGGRRCSDSS